VKTKNRKNQKQEEGGQGERRGGQKLKRKIERLGLQPGRVVGTQRKKEQTTGHGNASDKKVKKCGKGEIGSKDSARNEGRGTGRGRPKRPPGAARGQNHHQNFTK